MEKHMEQARMLAAQCWCDEETSGKEMDATLAEAFARRIAAWMETAAQMERNADFYCGLVDECAKRLGEAAYTADDGTVDDNICERCIDCNTELEKAPCKKCIHYAS